MRELTQSFAERETLEEGDWSTYGARKVMCERAVASTFGDRWSVVRACGIIGAHFEDDDPSKLYWPARISQRRPILGPGTGTDALQTVDVRDVAEFLLHLAATKQFGIYNAVGNTATTGEYVDTVRKVTGGTAPVFWSGRNFNVPMYADENRRPGFQRVSNIRARAAGLKIRSLMDSVQSNWDWFRANYPADYDFAAKGIGLGREAEAAALKQIAAGQPVTVSLG